MEHHHEAVMVGRPPARRAAADAPLASVLSCVHSGVFACVLMLPTKVGYIWIMYKHICNPYCIGDCCKVSVYTVLVGDDVGK